MSDKTGDKPPADVKYCPECGTEIESSRRVCTECGTAQDSTTGQQQSHKPRPEQQTQQPTGQQRPSNQKSGGNTIIWILIGLCVGVALIIVLLIFAAVIGAFVLGLGDSATAVPDTSFTYNYDSEADKLAVTVVEGDTLEPDQVILEGEGFDSVGSTWGELSGKQESITSNDEVTLTGVEEDFMLEIRWQSEDGTRSARLGVKTG